MHVFVDNMDNGVLEAVFGVLQLAVAVGKAIQLPDCVASPSLTWFDWQMLFYCSKLHKEGRWY